MAIGKSKLHELVNRAKNLSDAVAWYTTFNPKTKEDILNLIRQDQLFDEGIDSTGKVIGFYSYLTQQINPEKRAGDPYTLKDSGMLYASMYINVLAKSILIDGDDTKIQDQEWYSENIIGLTDENFQKLIQTVKEGYIKEARRVLFGTGFNTFV